MFPPERRATLVDNSASASVPVATLLAFKLVKPDPLPLNCPKNRPERLSPVDSFVTTTAGSNVSGIVPAKLPAFNPVNPLPSPEKEPDCTAVATVSTPLVSSDKRLVPDRTT